MLTKVVRDKIQMWIVVHRLFKFALLLSVMLLWISISLFFIIFFELAFFITFLIF